MKIKIIFLLLFIGLLCSCGTGTKVTYDDNLLPSQAPPAGLAPEQVPMFVSIGFDDNSYSGYEGSGGTGGMKWILDYMADKKNNEGNGNPLTYDSEACSLSFYMTTRYIEANNFEDNALVKKSWNDAMLAGHEIGVHTHSHPHGALVDWSTAPAIWDIQMVEADWISEIETCIDWLTKPYDPDAASDDSSTGAGVDISDIVGFRTPFLECDNTTFFAMQKTGMLYDCSLEEGWQAGDNGMDFYWPYTLDNGSPVADAIFEDWFEGRDALVSHPGLWEIPDHAVIAPPDEVCEQYGVEPGLRDRLKERVDYYDTGTGEVEGFDWNMWFTYQMTKEEFAATLKYTLDLRLKGNRAPFAFGAHSDIYSTKYESYNMSGYEVFATTEERQEAIEDFLEYAMTKPEVRIVSFRKIMEWMRNPSQL